MASNGVLSINESGLKNAKGILDNANTNLANARNQLTGITMPEKFSNSARLKTIPSSIQKVEKQVSGIQSYIDQKIKDFRKAEETAKNVANALGKSLAGLTTTAPSIIGSLSLQGRATNTSSKINFLIGGAKGIARAFETTAGILVAPTMYSTLLNLEIAASKGLVQLGENIADGALATLAEDASVLNWMFGSLIDKKQMEKMQKATMSFVSKDYTNNLYNYLNNNKLSKIINDFSLIKNDSNISNFVTNITNGGALFKVAEKAGPYGLIASATLGFLKGKGESTQAYWSQSDVKSMIDKGDNISNIFKKGTIYSDIKGLWSATSTAFQFATGAGGKVDYVLNKAWKRVLADSAAGGAEVYANAYAESVRTGKSYSEAFKDIGGHEAVAKSAATSGAVSAIGELVRWGLGNNANKDQDITKVTEQQEKNIYEDAEAIYTNEGKNVNVGLYSDGVQMKEEGQVIYDELDFRKGKTPFSKEHLQEVEQTIYSPSDALFMKNAKITGDYGNDQDVTHDLFDVVDSKGNVRRFGARDGAKKGIKDIGELEVVPKEGYKATKKYLTESTYKMSNLDAEQTISMMNSNTGLCKNARLSNELVQLNVDNAELYENIMGNKSKEAIQMCDSFIYHNHIENGGKIFRENNGRTEIIPGAVDGYSNGLAQDKGITKAGWLDNKGLYVATNDYAKIITGDKNIEASVTNLGTSEVTEQVYTEKMIEAQKVLKDGKGSVSINIPASEKSSINLATKNDKGEYAFHQGVNAHDITVTGVTKEGIVATSWGERVFASHQELFGNNCLLFITKKGK